MCRILQDVLATVSRVTCVTRPRDSAVGWPAPFCPDLPQLESRYSFTAEWTGRGSAGALSAKSVALPLNSTASEICGDEHMDVQYLKSDILFGRIQRMRIFNVVDLRSSFLSTQDIPCTFGAPTSCGHGHHDHEGWIPAASRLESCALKQVR